ncbi:MAG: DUF5060 domain-containing protein [Parvularculaceae bacterium]
MTWHAVTLTIDGPQSSETATPNPFTDFAIEATFRQGAKSFTVPGYFAACGNAAETSCDSGNKWRVKFAPDAPGQWTYELSFRQGANAALSGDGASVAELDGATGAFTVAASDKQGRDFRAADNGRLAYAGEGYLLIPDGRRFFKAGADAPENTLAYDDFDATPNVAGRRKSWSLHQTDFRAGEAGEFTWNGGRGSELLGAWSYLAEAGANVVSFLTFSLHGDDDNVFPHLLRVSESQYQGFNDARRWDDGVFHDRFDVSKLDQWDRVFSYGDQLGLYLHFKTMETENDQEMDGGSFGRERRLYYRELVARFGHHLALNWNLGEEWSLSSDLAEDTAQYIGSIDPYGHLRVLHTFPGQQNSKYGPLLGDASGLTGASIQTSNQNFDEARGRLEEWVRRSRDEGVPWVVGFDEPGSASRGVGVDASYPDNLLPGNDSQGDNRDLTRRRVLWNALTVGAAGVEYYYGYQTGCGDLGCQDHRSRATKWSDARNAIAFFNEHLGEKALDMRERDELLTTSTGGGGGSSSSGDGTAGVYVLPSSGTRTIAIEAEDAGTNPPGDWVFENDDPGFTGSGFYRWDGPDLFNINGAGSGVLSYVVEIPEGEGGNYRYVFRARRITRNDGRSDLNNDIWMRIVDDASGSLVQPNGQNGQPWWKMFFSGSFTNWVWSNSLDRQDGQKFDATYDLDPGRYRIEISGRSAEVHLDRMTLNQGTGRSTTTSLTTTPTGSTSGGAPAAAGSGQSDSDNYLFADAGETYVAYAVDDADRQRLDLSGVSGSFDVRWFDPINGGPLRTGSISTVSGGGQRLLGEPPSNPDGEWAILVTRR